MTVLRWNDFDDNRRVTRRYRGDIMTESWSGERRPIWAVEQEYPSFWHVSMNELNSASKRSYDSWSLKPLLELAPEFQVSRKKRTYPDGAKGMPAGRSGNVPLVNGIFLRAAT